MASAGTDRHAPSPLARLADALDIPESEFFQDGVDPEGQVGLIEAAQLARDFAAITDRATRHDCLAFVRRAAEKACPGR